MSEQLSMFDAVATVTEIVMVADNESCAPQDVRDAVSLEAARLVGEGMQVSQVLDAMLPAFGATIPGTTILDIVMRASRHRRGRRAA